MSLLSTISAFDEWRWAGRRLALITVVDTEGSTYTKPGHRMLVADNGDYHGLVSGGCLEGDLAVHASEVIAGGDPKLLTYDLRDEADEIWGLGIGCNGLLRLLVQRLDAEHHYQPYLDIAACHRSFAGGRLGIVTESSTPAIPPGATWLQAAAGISHSDMDAVAAEAVGQALAPGSRPGLHAVSAAGKTLQVLHAAVAPVPRLLVIGAGPDAVPLVRLAAELGWRVTVTDHRPAYLQAPGLEAADARIEARAGSLGAHRNPAEFHAAVVMTHHLDSDREHLRELAGNGPAYVGLLGPRARRDRLVRELAADGLALEPRLHGPVGLDIGADAPETIALAVTAEIQAHFARAPGPLDSPA
ncbi:MAG: XdhC family protein [Chromatiales bacterium]|nr:MAG: XdhC family protein [Chromatiales bacterium]